ncbi:hypothetical protein HDU77_004175 [Chytriomyces hyalinus]|nr:hypothetical protein HDU77_004175 [Chytriomyces hyalinus]
MDQRIDRCTMPHEFISDNLICVVCTDLLHPNTAVTIRTCSHMFCNECLSRSNERRVPENIHKCPMCQSTYPYTYTNLLPALAAGSAGQQDPECCSVQPIKTANPAVFRILSKLTFACKNASKGCVWTGSLLDDDTHAAECTAECQKPACKKAASELEACKIKCTNVESKFVACKNELEAFKIKFAGMERELEACKVRCAEAERRAVDAGGTARSTNESLLARHAEEVSRLNSQISQLNQNAQHYQTAQLHNAFQEMFISESGGGGGGGNCCGLCGKPGHNRRTCRKR